MNNRLARILVASCFAVVLPMLKAWSAEPELKIQERRVNQDGNVRPEDKQEVPVLADRITPIGSNLLEVEKTLTPPPPRIFSAFRDVEKIFWPFPCKPPARLDMQAGPSGAMLLDMMEESLWKMHFSFIAPLPTNAGQFAIGAEGPLCYPPHGQGEGPGFCNNHWATDA